MSLRDDLARTRVFVSFYLGRLRDQVRDLKAKKYPGNHPGPQKWLSLISGLLDTAELYLLEATNAARTEAEVQSLVTDASHLCSSAYYYLEVMSGSDVADLPFPLVSPLQRWFDALGIDQDTFFRTELVENYELRSFDRASFSGIRNAAPSLTAAINQIKWPMLRVTVPGRAMGIIPHFAIVAHEIGHAMMSKIPTVRVDAAVQSETAKINLALQRLGTTFVRVRPFIQQVLLNWIEEFAADAFAAFLAGPAALFSISEFLQLMRDHGITESHPANELRRAAIYKYMLSGSPSFASVFKAHTGIDLNESINSGLIVAAPVEADIVTDMANDGLGPDEGRAIAALHGSMPVIAEAVYDAVHEYLLANAKHLIYTTTAYEADLKEHLGPLLAAIPPIETGPTVAARTACEFASIINIGWAVLLAKLDELKVRRKTDDKLGSDVVERLHDLLLKAVELSEARRAWEGA